MEGESSHGARLSRCDCVMQLACRREYPMGKATGATANQPSLNHQWMPPHGLRKQALRLRKSMSWADTSSHRMRIGVLTGAEPRPQLENCLRM